MSMEDNRKSFRVEYKTPICTQISIVKVNDKAVTTGTGHICVENISSGGLKFLSSLNMPATDTMEIAFKLLISEEPITFFGHIIRKENLDNNLFRYGVKFVNDASENEDSIKKIVEFNELLTSNCSKVCTGNLAECIQKYKIKNNMRLYTRYTFTDDFIAKMNVFAINNNAIESRWEKIIINDISSGGVQFTSDFKLPEIDNMLLGFKLIISNREISATGHIVRQIEIKDGLYKYGIEFNIPDAQKKMISEVLKNVLDFSSEKGIYTRKCYSIKFNQQLPDNVNENIEWWV